MKYFGILSFALTLFVVLFFWLNVTSIIILDASMIRIFMITGIVLSIVFSLLSEKGIWKNISLGMSIFIGLFYLIGIEVMRMLFQGFQF